MFSRFQCQATHRGSSDGVVIPSCGSADPARGHWGVPSRESSPGGAMSSNPLIARREFVRATLGTLAAAPFAAGVFAQDSGTLPDSIDFKRLVAANRILAREEIVDAFG